MGTVNEKFYTKYNGEVLVGKECGEYNDLWK